MAQTQLSAENKDHSFLRVAKSMLRPHQSLSEKLQIVLVIRVHGLGIYPPFWAGVQHNDITCKHCSIMVCTLNYYFCLCFGYISAEDPSVFLSMPQAHPAPIPEGTGPYLTPLLFPFLWKGNPAAGDQTLHT